MQGVVPAAGEGTRMRPLTADRPKGLVEVGGEPLLTHVFETLTLLGVSELVVIVGYRGDQIRAYYGEFVDGVPITYVLTAEPEIAEDFVLLNGDNVIRANVDELVTRHRETNADVTALTERVPRSDAGKGAVFETQDGEIAGVVEKPETPPSTLVPRGCYAFSQAVLHACHLVTPGQTGEYELTDAVDLLLRAGRRLETIDLDGWCYNVNTPADRTAVAELLDERP
jgi:glucose-1-phosphate thymidylyltransferase